MTSLYQLHGYDNGHKLLQSNVPLSMDDQNLIDYLSDIAGQGPKFWEGFNPYLTCYPLPSRRYYILAVTKHDSEAKRAGCVLTRSALVPLQEWKDILSLDGVKSLVELSETPTLSSYFNEWSAALTNHYQKSREPLVLYNSHSPNEIAVRLLAALPANTRADFSVCTKAYKPRYLSDKIFDLTFAGGESARIYSSDARRIEMPNPS